MAASTAVGANEAQTQRAVESSSSIGAPISSPTISNISPSSYPADNNNHTMTINGSGFQNGASLLFHDPQGNAFNSNSSKLTFVNSTQLIYQFNDASDVGTWNVAVYNTDGGHSAQTNFQVGSKSSPTISSISPSFYPSDNNDHTMTIFGSGFQSGASLTFHDPQGRTYSSNSSKLTYVNSGQINYQFNDGSDPGTWNAAVNNPDGGNSAPANFQVNVTQPTISSISPSSYSSDNNDHTMTIFGANFESGAALTFHDPQGHTYNSNSSKLTYVNSGEIIYQFNDASDPGTWNVAVNNPDGGNSAPANFQVNVTQPTISSISPSSYPADNNNHAMAILGANFQNGASLVFHDQQGNPYYSTPAKLTFVSSGEIDYQFNDQSDSGTWNVTVDNPDGGASAAANFQVTAVSSPTISSISPSSYPSDGNNHAMAILGANFQNGASLTFHDQQGNPYYSTSAKLTFVSSSEIDYQFNDGSTPGTWNVAVNNPDGGASGPVNFQVTAVSSPTISSISPSSYSSDNNNHAMTINGSGFQSGATLLFHDPQNNPYTSDPNKLTFISSSQISYQFNDGTDPGTWNVTVNNPDGGSSGPANFQVTAASSPTISSISPSSYPSDNNNHAMAILGTNFQSGASLVFHDPQGNPYYSSPAKLTFVSSSEIDYQFNDQSDPGTWNVTVNNPDGGASAPANFQVGVSSPIISSIAPSSYPADYSDHAMTVNGSGFQNGASLVFHDPQGKAYYSKSYKLTFISSSQINYQFNDGSDAGTWNVAVNNPDGGSSGPANFQVTANNLEVNGFSGNYTSENEPYKPTINLTGSGFESVTEISWSCLQPNGKKCDGSPYIWKPSNWSGKFVVSSDNTATVSPVLLATGDPQGGYSWSVTFYTTSQSVVKNFTVAYQPGLVVDGFSQSYSSQTAPYTPNIALTGSGYASVTQIAWSYAMPNGTKRSGSQDIWKPANWRGKYVIYGDNSSGVFPGLLKASDPAGTYQWSVTFYALGQQITKFFSVIYQPAPALTVNPSASPVGAVNGTTPFSVWISDPSLSYSTATDGSNWVHIKSGGSGTGNGRLWIGYDFESRQRSNRKDYSHGGGRH